MTADAQDAGRFVARPGSRTVTWAVPRLYGYRMPQMPGVHRGLPSPYLALVFSLSGEFPIDIPTAGGLRPGAYSIPLGGLHTEPVLLPQVSRLNPGPARPQRGIQLAVNPLASRMLFGLPAGELSGDVFELDTVVGNDAGMLREQLALPISAASAVELVTAWVEHRLARDPPDHLVPELGRAWRLIVGSGGRLRIADVARDVGWSRRHLTARLRAETGLGAKDLARVTRFQRSRSMLLKPRRPLVDIATACGYADQSHLTAEWREFAGCTPGQWIAAELPSLSELEATDADPISSRRRSPAAAS
jgi:AraC-like DNA-binding protein